MRRNTFNVKTLIAIAFVLLAHDAFSQPGADPRFEDYPSLTHFSRRPAPAIISGSRARLFRTAIRTQARNQPNFAGSYVIAIWGCGSDCRGFAVIDSRTGRVYFNSRTLNVAGILSQDEDTLQFRRDSRLLIISGSVDGFRGYQAEAKFFYEWVNNRFRLLKKAKVKVYRE